jgi:cell division protein ZapE
MLAEIYQKRVSDGEMTRDAGQEYAAAQFDLFLLRWNKPGKSGLISKLKGKAPKPVKGIFLYGGVGRGKTTLMDMFVAALHAPDVRRVHFHAFMLEIHARLKALRDQGETDDILPHVAEDIAKTTRLLCFDELHVNDIADAMIIGGLFRALFDNGVTVIATSNYRPDDLYKDGLQRARFLPFIDLIKENLDVVRLDSPTDYRMRTLSEKGMWFYPLTDQSWSRMDNLFTALTGDGQAHPTSIEIGGRDLPIERADDRCAWMTFATLCQENRGASDYLALGAVFKMIFVDEVPRLSQDNRNEARRFMTLVDTLYDAGRVLVIRAAATPEALYDGDANAFEWQRTVSRLLEMQSPEWLARQNVTP